MQHSLTQGPITKNILLSATPLGVTGIWLSVPIGWALADAIGIGYYLKKRTYHIPRCKACFGTSAAGDMFFYWSLR